MAGLSIGALAKATGTKTETIRYYERIGIMPRPGRTEGNYRSYGRTELNRLSFVRRARDLGFSIDQVRALLDLADDRTRSCGSVDALAREHVTEIDRKIADLSALRRELSALLEQCSRGTIADCRIVDALGPEVGAAASRLSSKARIRGASQTPVGE